MLKNIYATAIYAPLLNGFVFIYTLLPYRDIGLAIVVFTVAIRLLLLRFSLAAARYQQAVQLMQPRLKELQERLKNNREELARQSMALWREYGIHPFASIVPLLIQIPILIGMFQVFSKGVAKIDPGILYGPLRSFSGFDPLAFGLVNLAAVNHAVSVVAGVSFAFAQWVQREAVKSAPDLPGKRDDFARAMQWQSIYVLPVIIVVFSWFLPAALPFYWTIFNLLAIVEQLWIRKKLHERESGTSRKPAPGAGPMAGPGA